MNQFQAPVRSSGLAVASMVLGIIGLCAFPLGFLAVIFGHVALRKIKKSAGTVSGQGLAITGLITGYLGVLFSILFVAALASGFLAEKKEKEEAATLFSLVNVDPPEFPDPADWQEVGEKGVRYSDLSTSGTEPGQTMQFRVYLPPEATVENPVACVLVPPAGSNLLSGLSLDGGDYHDETLPYAEAGMVVISYSIDGVVGDEEDDEEIEKAYKAFRDAAAGVINGRNAMEFAREKIPQVDPDRIFAAGHSSAATVSLLLASHLPELAGVVAYAPVCDLEEHYRELSGMPMVSMVYPGLSSFLIRSSPSTHISSIDVPVFLFYAKDDDKVSYEEGRELVRLIEEAGGEASIRTVENGGHYGSMISEGIPSGIEWIGKR